MKTKLFKSSLAALAIAILFAFTPPATTRFIVDKNATVLEWTGKKLTGEHKGRVAVSAGELITDGKTVKQGNFEIDLNALTVTDITDPDYNAKLVGHLKNEDFFNVSAYPTASFVLSSVTSKGGDQYQLKGKLTVKGITKDIEFPAVIKNDGKRLTAHAKIKVDRTQFNIRYGSASFFDNLGDKAIDNEFELDLKLVAVAASTEVSSKSKK
jgi:polyisoprenoid-binding protein YceI